MAQWLPRQTDTQRRPNKQVQNLTKKQNLLFRRMYQNAIIHSDTESENPESTPLPAAKTTTTVQSKIKQMTDNEILERKSILETEWDEILERKSILETEWNDLHLEHKSRKRRHEQERRNRKRKQVNQETPIAFIVISDSE